MVQPLKTIGQLQGRVTRPKGNGEFSRAAKHLDGNYF